MRKEVFEDGEYYHIYNQGVEKRSIFGDEHDASRFVQCMKEFNCDEPIGSLYWNNFGHRSDKLRYPTTKLVEIVAYCVNPNHFHFILCQKSKGGISEFMKRLAGGYARYFNNKNKRRGVLFQGRFRAKHINSNEYLLRLSAYVNLNDRVHKLRYPTTKFNEFSSWGEYVNGGNFCTKGIILEQFKNVGEYRKFAKEALVDILEKKKEAKDLENYFLE